MKWLLQTFGRKNKPRKAVFMHIQKTAGTAFVSRVAREYGQGNFISHADYLSMSREECGKHDFISGHFGYEYARHFIKDRYSFTFLRDPRDRLLSLYYFCRSRAPDEYPINAIARDNNLEDFLKHGFNRDWRDKSSLFSRLWNLQAWMLAQGWYRPDPDDAEFRHQKAIFKYEPKEIFDLAVSHLKEFDHIGFVETIDEDAKKVLKDLRCDTSVAFVRKNASKRDSRIEDLPQSTLSVMDDLTELDREVYRIAWEKRAQEPKPPQ